MSWLPEDVPPTPGGPPRQPHPPVADASWPAPYRLPQGSFTGPLTGPPAPRPRRRRPRLGVVLLVVVLVAIGFRVHDRYPIHVGNLADVVAGRAPLVSVRAADSPPPGLDETGAPLLEPPVVWNESASHAFIQTQTLPDGGTAPVRWSPCRSIYYVVNEAGAPTGFREVVAAEVSRLSTATGLVLVEAGTTDEVPVADREPYQRDRYGDRWAPVLVAFADLAVLFPDLDAAGVATPISAHDPTTGVQHYVSGTVLLDPLLLDVPWYAGEPGYVPVLRHELGHAVGLDHVDDPMQVMNTLSRAVVDYGDGDRTGLAALGSGPCAPGL